MTEIPGTPMLDSPHWAQRRDDLLASRAVRREAVLEAIHRFRAVAIEARKTRIEARLQLARDLAAARFAFRRALVRNFANRAAHAGDGVIRDRFEDE